MADRPPPPDQAERDRIRDELDRTLFVEAGAGSGKTSSLVTRIVELVTTGGVELRTTVMPFILRGVSLLGIDSALCPLPVRSEVWRRLATDMKPADLNAIAHDITLEGLPAAFDTLLAGKARGRFVVHLKS